MKEQIKKQFLELCFFQSISGSGTTLEIDHHISNYSKDSRTNKLSPGLLVYGCRLMYLMKHFSYFCHSSSVSPWDVRSMCKESPSAADELG